MQVLRTDLPEVLILEPRRHTDDRGYFMETYNQRAFDRAVGRAVHFVQDNQSRSRHGVLRGLHYQLAPHEQGKLVRAVHGKIFDVAVDMRHSSPRFGRWVGVELSDDNCRQLWIPPGFAHGFLVLSDTADVVYKTTDFYAPESEGSVHWADPNLAIGWPSVRQAVIVAPKDDAAPKFQNAHSFD